MQEPSSKAPKPSSLVRRSARIALWLMPLVVGIYLFYQSNLLAEAVGCQLGETCIAGDGATATYLAFAAFAVFIGFAFFLLIFSLGKSLNSFSLKI